MLLVLLFLLLLIASIFLAIHIGMMNGKGVVCDCALLVCNPDGICCCCLVLPCLARLCPLLRLFLLVPVVAGSSSTLVVLITLELSLSSCVPSSSAFCPFLRLRRKLLLPRLFTDEELLGTIATSGELTGEEDDDAGVSIGFEDMLKSSMMRS